jgi:hypothetical protein
MLDLSAPVEMSFILGTIAVILVVSALCIVLVKMKKV